MKFDGYTLEIIAGLYVFASMAVALWLDNTQRASFVLSYIWLAAVGFAAFKLNEAVAMRWRGNIADLITPALLLGFAIYLTRQSMLEKTRRASARKQE